MKLILIACVIAVVAIVGFFKQRCLMRYYQARPVLYRAWIARYGKESRAAIQSFIRCYCKAFNVSPKIIHRFGPDDGLFDYYRRDYRYEFADAMEPEQFALQLEKQYGIQFTEDDCKLTMGQMFEKLTNIRPQAKATQS
jgi:hypothetical protein